MDKIEKDLKRIFDFFIETRGCADLYPVVINCDMKKMKSNGSLPYQMSKTVSYNNLKYKNGDKTLKIDLDMCKHAIDNKMVPWNCFFVACRNESEKTKYKAYIPLKKETFYEALEEFTPLLGSVPYCTQNKYRVYPSNDTIVFRFYDIKGALYLNDYINMNPHLKEYIGENLYIKKLDNIYIMEEKYSSSYMTFVTDTIREYFNETVNTKEEITKENFINFINNNITSDLNKCDDDFKEYLLDVLNGNNEFKYNNADAKTVYNNNSENIESKKEKSLYQMFSIFLHQYSEDSNLIKFIYNLLSTSSFIINQRKLKDLEVRALYTMSKYIASDLENELLNNDNLNYYLNDKCFNIIDTKNNKSVFKINLEESNVLDYFDEFSRSITKEPGTIGYANYKNKKCYFSIPCTRSMEIERYNKGLSSMFIITKGEKNKEYTVDEIGLDGSVINKKVDFENQKEFEYIKYSNTSGRVNVYKLSKDFKRINKKLIISDKKGEPDDVKIYSIKRKKII